MNIAYILLRFFAGFLACVDQSIAAFGQNFSDTELLFLHHFFGIYQILFFMLSGRFLLAKEYADYKRFYVRRILKIGLPFIVFSFLSLTLQIGFSVSLGFAKDFCRGFLTGTISDDFSFMYLLFTFYLVVPFLAKMVQSLDVSKRISLLFVIGGYYTFFDFCVITDSKLSIASFPFLNLFGYALAGYLLDHIQLSKKKERLLIIIGFFALLVSYLEICLCPGVNWSIADFSLTRYLTAVGLWLLLSRNSFAICIQKTDTVNDKVLRLMNNSIYYFTMLVLLMLQFLKKQ